MIVIVEAITFEMLLKYRQMDKMIILCALFLDYTVLVFSLTHLDGNKHGRTTRIT
jgi:hypothetical protein